MRMSKPVRHGVLAGLLLLSGVQAAPGAAVAHPPAKAPIIQMPPLNPGTLADTAGKASTAAAPSRLPDKRRSTEPGDTTQPAPLPDTPLPPESLDQAVDIPDIPVVPASVLPRGRPKAVSSLPTKSTLAVFPGVNEVIPIARGALNRLMTPFAHPEVTTTSNAHTEVRGSVVYVATAHAGPVTLFVTEKGDERQAMSLTLLPKRLPPREVILRLAGDTPASAGTGTRRRAAQWEESQSYISLLRDLFRRLALGEVPPGYALQRVPVSASEPVCRQRGLRFDFQNGQVLTGRHLQVQVGIAQNRMRRPVSFQETACRPKDVAAVAAWPGRMLRPGQQTEIYVARLLSEPPSKAVQRPSLLGGGP